MTYREHMKAQSDAYLREVLERTHGNCKKAAKLAGMHPSTFHKIVVNAKLIVPRRVYGNASWQELRA